VIRAARALTALTLVAAAFSGLSLLGAPAAWAHPLGNFTVNVSSGIEVSPGSIRIHYVLDMAEIPTFQLGPTVDTDGDGRQSPAEWQVWADGEAAELLAGLDVRQDGRRLVPLGTRATVDLVPGQAGLPTLRLEATFTATLGETGTVIYEDGNFADRLGWKEVTVRSTPGVAITRSTVPTISVSGELRSYPEDMLASPLRVSAARFSFRPGHPSSSPATASPGQASRPGAGLGGSFAALVTWRLTPFALAVSLLLALLFGVVHALLPGHGKTITAAYLVGSEAPVRTAVVAGLAVAVMHTVSVLGLGLIALVLFRSVATERVYPWLGMVTGVVALALGLVLLVRRVRGGRRPVHGHDHGHPSVASRRGLAALAIAGGILPSPTALVVLTAAISYGRLAYGLALIVAFGLGLAGALILVGVAAVRTRAAVERRFHGRWVGLVPVGSATAIAGAGAFLVLRGIAQVA
jgi:nickel/cobalt exporter